MALSRFSTYSPVSIRWLLLLTTIVLFVSATINLQRDVLIFAVIEYILSVLCFLTFIFFKQWITDKNIIWLSIIYSNLVFSILIYGTMVEGVSITIYLWLSVIPFISYLLSGIFWGFISTVVYFILLSITFLNNFDSYAHQITTESLFNLLASVTVLWILTHSYAVSNIKVNKKLLSIAMKDSLTKLNNRHAFYEFFKQNRHNAKSLMIIDLDFFKKVNDNYGHDAGDYILQTVADIFNEQASKEEFVFRLGGEEFAVFLPNTNLTQASNIAHKINASIKEYQFIYHKQAIKITASIGVAYSTDDDLNALMRRADTCLYQAKNNGRDCVVIDKSTLA